MVQEPSTQAGSSPGVTGRPDGPGHPPTDAAGAALPQSPSFLKGLAGKWQIPLLVGGLLLLVTGLPRLLRPADPLAGIEQRLSELRQLRQQGASQKVVDLADRLLALPVDPAQRSYLHLIRGLSHLAMAESSGGGYQRVHARRAAEDLESALRLAGSVEALDHRLVSPAEYYAIRGRSKLLGLESAKADLVEALARLGEGQDRMRKQLIEPLCQIDPGQAHRELDTMLARPGLAAADRLWAIRHKTRLLTDEARSDDAERLVESCLDQSPAGADRDALELEQARVHYQAATSVLRPLEEPDRQRHLDKAFLLLSAIQLRRAALGDQQELDAELHWLLGEVHYLQGRPGPAEEAFEQVVRGYPNSRFGRAARLGRAKSAALCKPVEQAHDAYERVVEELRTQPDDALVDRQAVRRSLTVLADQLRGEQRWESAHSFLVLLERMLDPFSQNPSPADVKEQQGNVLRKLALEEKQQSDKLTAEAVGGRLPASPSPEAGRLNAQARRHLRMAADAYLEAAKLVTDDDKRSGDDLEMAASCYDEAGELAQAIVVLKRFIRDYPGEHRRLVRAIFNLGRAYQAAGQYAEAIVQYQRIVAEYPNSPDANKSKVPMAQCHKALRQFDQAEAILTGLLGDDEVFSPDSLEYVEALFELAKLKYERGQYRQAIARFDEALQREPDHRQALYSRYYLADSYRLSGVVLNEAIASAKTPVERQQLVQTRTAWLRQARTLFDEAVALFEARAGAGRSDELDRLYLRNAYFFRADCLFDLGQYEEAVWLYDLAALKYHGQPEAVAAFVQIVNCYNRMGKPQQARTANERAKWLLKKLPADEFTSRPLPLSKDYFARWLDWIGQSGTW